MVRKSWRLLVGLRGQGVRYRRFAIVAAFFMVALLLFLVACGGTSGHPASVTPSPPPPPPPPPTGLAHGMFILDPPTDDGHCMTGYPPSCYSLHLVPTLICSGPDTPAGYGCTQAGAGTPFVKGAAFHVSWSSVNSSDGTYDFSSADSRMRPWVDAGKVVSLVFEPASFGSSNRGTPQWYLAPTPISIVSQTAGI